MELVTFAKDVAQNIAEKAAGYRLGQTALRHLDKALWVVEKCARWAVPPPLDQDDKPQPELVRPLPWVFFLAMLVTLRVSREFISLVNLVLGKPPLRSADVVVYIQSKRRYLRALKYQGNRVLRARSSAQNKEPWYGGLQSLFEFTMCFRRSHKYENNNTTRISNNDEVLVVKRSKRTRPNTNPEPSTSEAALERLIERIMTDLDAESDDDSSFTLTNATSIRSDRSEYGSGSDDDTLENLNDSGKSLLHDDTTENVEMHGKKDVASSTPEGKKSKTKEMQGESSEGHTARHDKKDVASSTSEGQKSKTDEMHRETSESHTASGDVDNKVMTTKTIVNTTDSESQALTKENEALSPKEYPKQSQKPKPSPKSEARTFLLNEKCPPKSPQKSSKFGLQSQNPTSEGYTAKTHSTDETL